MSAPDITVQDISRRLADQAETLCSELLPRGRKDGLEWRVGSVKGEPGNSLGIRLSGPKAGIWSDFNGGEHGGDMLDLIQLVLGFDKGNAVQWAKARLGIDNNPFSLPASEKSIGDQSSFGRRRRKASDTDPEATSHINQLRICRRIQENPDRIQRHATDRTRGLLWLFYLGMHWAGPVFHLIRNNHRNPRLITVVAMRLLRLFAMTMILVFGIQSLLLPVSPIVLSADLHQCRPYFHAKAETVRVLQLM